MKKNQIIFIIVLIILYPLGVSAHEINLKGFGKKVMANGNSISSIESEILSFGNETDWEMNWFQFKRVKILLLEKNARHVTDVAGAEGLYFECIAETSDELVTQKEIILLAYIKLRLNGMSHFNSSRFVAEMIKKRERLRAHDVARIPVNLLEKIDKIPIWISKYYIRPNYSFVANKSSPELYQLKDQDIVWLFLDHSGKIECICGYDGKHDNLTGFHQLFERVVSRKGMSGKLNRSDSDIIADTLKSDFSTRWLHPLEIPFPYD